MHTPVHLQIIVRPPRPEEMEAYYQLRWETLRQDRGLPPGSERDELDNTDEVRHLAAFVQLHHFADPKASDKASSASSPATNADATPAVNSEWKMVGVGRLELLRSRDRRMAEHAPPHSVAASDFGHERVGRARLMGVAPEWRRKGVGRALAEATLEAARGWECSRVVADARAEAVDYYLACGFNEVSDDYYIKDIGPHKRVEKRL